MHCKLLLLLGLLWLSLATQAQEPGQKEKPSRINKILGKGSEKLNPSNNQIQLISPVNNAVINNTKQLSELSFKWDGAKVSTTGTISYRIKIWHAKSSQQIKTAPVGEPIVQAETQDLIYNPSICDTLDYPENCKCPKCYGENFYAWNITAYQNGKIVASSTTNYYSTTDAGCGTNKAAVKITCGKIIEGLQSYNVTVIFSNVVPAPGGQQCTTKMTGITSPTGTTSSITTLPVIIPVSGSSPSVSFVYIPTNPAASTADFKYTGTWNDPDNNTSNFRTEKFELPRCSKPVNCCENAKWGTNKILNTHVASPLPACGADIGVMKCKEVKRLEFCFICPPGCDSAKLTYQIFPVNNNTPVSAGTLTNCALSPVTMPSVSGAYQIVVTPECNGVKCTPCKYNFKVDCEKPGDCCANSKWGDISYIKETGQTVGYPANGGNLGEFRCGSNLRTKVCYTCPPGCGVAQIRYDIYMVNSVLLVSSVTKPACSLENIPLPANGGVYQLIVTPICNGKECQGKDYIFTVKCPVETDCCTGGKWIPPFLPPPAPTPQNNLSYVVSIPANGSICGKDLQTVKCSTYMNFRFAYQCAATGNCPATITYVLRNVNTNSVINTYANIANSSNLAVLAPPASGYYSMKAYAKCGDKICDSCTVNFKVECPASGDCCKGGYWMNLNIAKDQVNYVPMGACGSKIGDLKCNEKFKLNTEWECDEKCGQVTSTITYQIFNSANTQIGTSTSGASGATVTLTTPSVSGNYYLKLVSKCGDKVCDSCKFYFSVDCSPAIDCCKGGSWTNKSINWDIRIRDNAGGFEIQQKPSLPNTSNNPIPTNNNIPVICNETIKLTQNGTFTFNAGYNCAAGKDCTKSLKVKIRGNNNNSLDGTFNLPLTKTFTQSGTYNVTYYAYCGTTICDSCVFTVAVDKDCCQGSKWKKAQYQVVNKKPDGSWDESDQTFYNLPLSIGSNGVPTVKADVGITVDNLDYECPEISGCNASYIIRRKNLTTGVFEPDEVLTNGKDDCSVYAKPYPQMIWIIPQCGGQRCGVPIIFKIECLSKNCDPCLAKKTLNINTGIDLNGSLIASNSTDPFWATAYSRNIVQSGWPSNTTSQKLTPVLNSNTAPGNFSFTRSFYVCQRGDIKITGSVLCDNKLLSLELISPTSTVLWSAPTLPTPYDNISPNGGGAYNFSTTILLSPGQYRIVATYRNRTSLAGFETDGWFELRGTISATNGEVVNTIQDCCTSSGIGNASNEDTVKICEQTWMKKNLDVTTYRNGDPIPEIQDPTQWANATTGAWCYYNNDPAMGTIYGKLYNSYAVTDPRGLAPMGWHVPSNTDWIILQNCLGGPSLIGNKIKSFTNLWQPSYVNTDINSSGFSALPSGLRSTPGGQFILLRNDAYWWSVVSATNIISCVSLSSTGNPPSVNNNFSIYNSSSTASNFGYAVRCIKD